MSELLEVSSGLVGQVLGSTEPWSASEWERAVSRAGRLAATESSFRVLGEVLGLDDGLELPVEIVMTVYRRLVALGASDARTLVCFARYMLLHGPEWDVEANSLLASVETAARAAGLWDAPYLGHHLVFFANV